ncbi:Translation initiation factor IF-3 [Boseongicola aestuarii]|uniref:Translation initiation factor IF-3 n=1 Tax=Boseongicola aestuarii TaxID=1470561 RepID=A0A238J242_9RHOB|nr:Translation initiation factor IF-3 [Boseongicola aestuarii]
MRPAASIVQPQCCTAAKPAKHSQCNRSGLHCPRSRFHGCKQRELPLIYATRTVITERTLTIARRPHNAPPVRNTGPRINEHIRAPEIRLIGAEGENVGVVTPERAVEMAIDAGLDLVEISPNATPPVCKIMDFGKFKYEQQKRESEARKKQKIIEVKEIKFRPNTDTNDYDVKMRNVMRFLEAGDKVKITLRFRGREMAHQNLGRELLERVADDVEGVGKVENMPKMEGRQMVMMIGPAK